MTATEKILDAAKYQYQTIGYVDLKLLSKMVNIPSIIAENVITQHGFVESNMEGQFIKRGIRND